MTLGKNFIRISISILLLWPLVKFLNYISSSEDPLKEGLNVIVGYVCIGCFGFGFGSILLYDRRQKAKAKSSFFYCFIATLNVAIGLVGLYSLFSGILNLLGFIFCLVPFVIGIAMLVLLFDKSLSRPPNSHNISLPK
jgi:hypothetical protein